MSNVTVDDTSPTISYGPGWGVASPTDPALSNYFLSTYHASETPGALVNLYFSGTATAIYLYGSKGPNRGNFSVRYDGNIEQLSAYADTEQYQQLLFGATFNSTTQPHTLTLNNTSGEQGPTWLDVDFFTITDGNISTAHQSTLTTISPLPSSTISNSSAGGSQNDGDSRCSSSCKTTLSTSIVFGIITLLLLLGLAVHFVMQRFRSTRPTPIPDNGHRRLPSEQTVRSPGSAFRQERRKAVFSYQHDASSTEPSTLGMAGPYPPMDAIEPIADADPEMREGSMSVPHSYSLPRSRSPFIGSGLKVMFGGSKQGADSMKSTFLKV